jgi:hypothetical protein
VTAVSIFFQMVALNGVSEKQGMLAMGLSLAFQLGLWAGLCFLAGRISRQLTLKYAWNRLLAIGATVFGAVFFAVVLSFCSLVVSTLIAGIR